MNVYAYVIAIVQFIQKKYPKIFKNEISSVSKSTVTNQAPFSPRSDIGRERRLSNQSMTSGVSTSPNPITNPLLDSIAGKINKDSSKYSQSYDRQQLSGMMGAAANEKKIDVNNMKQQAQNIVEDGSLSLSQQAPFNLKNLMFAQRLGQQVTILTEKKKTTDREILQDELIKPTSLSEKKDQDHVDQQKSLLSINDEQTYGTPSVEQLIKHKEKLRLENDHGSHRKMLAKIADDERHKSDVFVKNISKPEAILDIQAQIPIPEANVTTPTIHTKQEEEILAEEDIFRTSKKRRRERQKQDGNRKVLNNNNRQTVQSTFQPTLNFGVCKHCGNIMSNEENDRTNQTVTSKPLSIVPIMSNSVQQSKNTDIDDWFESASDISRSSPKLLRQWMSDEHEQYEKPMSQQEVPQLNSRNLFTINTSDNRSKMLSPTITAREQQPSSDILRTENFFANDSDTQSTFNPVLLPQTATNNRLPQPMGESGTFTRLPEQKFRHRRSSSVKSASRHSEKEKPTALPTTVSVIQQRSTKRNSSTIQQQPKNLNVRRTSNWGVVEHSPDDSD
ncbi:unnamed protein product [Didymodactylos carnosus]|uniref:Uncharacterized protein n=1 Tax=Didymodactylos carnosus TaxID=1234261 RepID=A0A813QWN3_9BILA|nr:unnamed protein product [Didymodactylos carnosus]CAF0773517.1 unnamed protein product [Didymodactylos carnosus]CAF3507793.1 unnamed protein product [Didymodactylos carnosus]CAF3555889.1 unnamed protein product [Didymodactylos carnosus]